MADEAVDLDNPLHRRGDIAPEQGLGLVGKHVLGRDRAGVAAVGLAGERADAGRGDGPAAFVDHDGLDAGLVVILVAERPTAPGVDVSFGEVAEVAQLVAVLLGPVVERQPRGELCRVAPTLSMAVPCNRRDGRCLCLQKRQNNFPYQC